MKGIIPRQRLQADRLCRQHTDLHDLAEAEQTERRTEPTPEPSGLSADVKNSAAQYIQVGVTALRAPDGSFLPAVPLYIKSTPESKAAEETFTKDITGVLAQRMKLYMEQTNQN